MGLVDVYDAPSAPTFPLIHLRIETTFSTGVWDPPKADCGLYANPIP